jgi:ferritin-like metal-binding protein YciE
MARYGTLAGWASQLGMPEAAALLNETLQEEMDAEKLLTQIDEEQGRQDRRHEGGSVAALS